MADPVPDRPSASPAEFNEATPVGAPTPPGTNPPYYGDLSGILAGVKGHFILSLGDHERIREIFKGFKLETVTTSYSRGKSRESRSKARAELIITNY